MELMRRGRSWVAGHAETWTRICVCLLLAIQAALLAWGARLHSPTIDEPTHLAAGVRHLKQGRFDLDRGNPPLSDTIGAIPAALMGPATNWRNVPNSRMVALDFVDANGVRIFWYTTAGRWACIPIALLGGIVCYRWARDLFGRASGLMALTMWCFCPSVLAHGQLITGDMSSMSLGVLSYYAFWRWLSRPTVGRAALAGAALGLCELSKFVWVVSFILWPALWLAWREFDIRNLTRRELLGALLIFALSIAVINFGYGFRGTLRPLGNFRQGRELLALPKTTGAGGPTGLKAWIAALPVPLPADYVLGISEIESLYATVPRDSYLRGEWKNGTWWYYYLYGLAVKIPLGVWVLFGAASAATLFGKGYSSGWRDELLLLAPVVQLLVFVTCVTTMQHHVRYVMPVLPFIFIFSSKLARAFAHRHWPLAVTIAGALTWSVVSSLAVYPHSLSYFNELAGGPRGGHYHLLDSNIAWGQDLLYLKRWLDQHPEARPLYVVESGLVPLSLFGFDYRTSPPEGSLADDAEWPPPGWHIMSVEHMHKPGYEYFLRHRPVARAGYSIHIYHVAARGKANDPARPSS